MLMFEPILAGECCLCAATGGLTGEHKIKASAIRRIFGTEAMMIGHFDGESEPRVAQGPKSSALHFSARLCGQCNAARTQPADREFDRFHERVSARFECSQNPETLFPSEDYPSGSTVTLNIFRYFAKLLSCQIADAGGPRLPVLAAFAIGTIDFNPVKLIIKADPTYQDFALLSPDLAALAGHGGLVVNHDKEGLLNSFHSTLTIGPIQYVYWVEFNGSVSEELNSAAPEFYARTQSAFAKALDEPMSDHMRRKLGFLSADDGGAPD